MSQFLGERRHLAPEALIWARSGVLGSDHPKKTSPEKPLEALSGLGRTWNTPKRFGESVSPPSDREDRHTPASGDRDDVFGSAVEATNNPLAGFRFGRRSEEDATIFTSGFFHVCWRGSIPLAWLR